MFCLVRPPAIECVRFATTSISLPLGLAYVAGALEAAGRRVTVIDAVGESPKQRTRYLTGYLIGLSLDDVAARIPDDCTVVGITVIFTHEWPAAVRLIDLIKARRPDLTIVLGGEHITSMPEFCLLTSKADVLVLGEGEETIVDLADALENGRPLAEVDGIAFRANGQVTVNRRRRRRRDVDAIARPAWQHFKIETYHDNRFVGGIYSPHITIPILATRGCPYQCTYCSAPSMWTPLWIPRDPVKVVDEIEHYARTYGARNFPFQDLTAIIQKDWIVRFCQELLDRKLDVNWQLPSGTRSEAIDPEVAGLLRRSNMTNMAYAPESGSETTRKLIKKKMHTEKLFQSIDAAVGAGLNVSMFMVLGLPHDDEENIRENLPFLDRLVQAGVSDISVSFYMALPGTELFDSLYDRGRLKLDRTYFTHMLHNLSLVPVESFSDHLSRRQLLQWKFRMFLRFYNGKRGARSGIGLIAQLRRGLSGLGSGGHDSKLQTAFRNAVHGTWDTIRVQFKKGWLPRRDEAGMFESWNAIYQEVRRGKIAQGVSVTAPADTTELHKQNVVVALRREHEQPRTLPVPALSEPAVGTRASA
jgi:radical SAM superfamily enzyme YgiQ (UPF0313 family)